MLRLDGRRRAPFFDDTRYTQYTIETYDRRARPYERGAHEAGLEPLEASGDWILGFFMRQAVTSIREARKMLPAVAHYFRAHGRGDGFPYDAVLDLLRETSAHAQDPVMGTLSAIPLARHTKRRARAFAGKSMLRTRERYGQYASGWEVYARKYDFDPQHAADAQFRGFLWLYARTHRYRSVSNLCSALSHYFRSAQVDDLTRHEEIRDYLAALAREDAETTRYRPLFAEDLRAMLSALGTAPLDVRDRNVLLLNYYGALFGADMHELDTQVAFRDDGVIVTIDGQDVFIGAVDDPELDIRIWMRRWLDILPAAPGPLFPALTERGEWAAVPLSTNQLCKIVKRAARRANITVPHPTLALRKGFAIRVHRVVGPVQTAKHMRMKKTTSLEAHVRLDRQGKRTRAARIGAPVYTAQADVTSPDPLTEAP
jgi:hypothetical protein